MRSIYKGKRRFELRILLRLVFLINLEIFKDMIIYKFGVMSIILVVKFVKKIMCDLVKL